MPPRIFFLRHGETDWNVEFRLQGQRDTPLNPRGRDQASAVGRMLRDYFGGPGGPGAAGLDFIASPLARCRETMERARTAMGLDPIAYATDPRLMELSFGRWEGLTWSEVKAMDPWAAKAREGDKWDFQRRAGASVARSTRRRQFRRRPWGHRAGSHGHDRRNFARRRARRRYQTGPRDAIRKGRVSLALDSTSLDRPVQARFMPEGA